MIGEIKPFFLRTNIVNNYKNTSDYRDWIRKRIVIEKPYENVYRNLERIKNDLMDKISKLYKIESIRDVKEIKTLINDNQINRNDYIEINDYHIYLYSKLEKYLLKTRKARILLIIQYHIIFFQSKILTSFLRKEIKSQCF